MSVIWTRKEISSLEQNLVDGILISNIQKHINRTEGAISKKAHSYGFITEDLDGFKVIKKGITRRNTGVPEYEKLAKEYPDYTVINMSVAAAFSILEEHNIIDEPNIVNALSEQIFKSMREGTYYGK